MRPQRGGEEPLFSPLWPGEAATCLLEAVRLNLEEKAESKLLILSLLSVSAILINKMKMCCCSCCEELSVDLKNGLRSAKPIKIIVIFHLLLFSLSLSFLSVRFFISFPFIKCFKLRTGLKSAREKTSASNLKRRAPVIKDECTQVKTSASM